MVVRSLAEDQRRARAFALGLSLAEYIRRLIRADLGQRPAAADVSAVFGLGNSGGSDIARHKDHYLGEAVEARLLGRTRTPR